MRAPYQPRCSPVPRFTATDVLPPRFSVLVWNVHKLPVQAALGQCNMPSADIWLLQEAAWQVRCAPDVDGVMTPNLRTRSAHFGVWTGSRYRMKPLQQVLTRRRELRLLTRKAALLSTHPLANGETLWVLNVHMLLSRSHRIFEEELSRLLLALQAHAGPLIVAGDFNTWSRRRLATLQWRMAALDLTHASPHGMQHLKAHRGRVLDHLFYRGLVLTEACVLPTDCSDHAPIVAHFEQPS
ncbi:Uncharacterized conserved protein YafD, endonuclease/exonuclease/phosphatase (EEP) superfamily [Sulfurivirga caldicuralii]|uniref:Uncharacterized conserved protein YafD, endonuclease/exonuclease/phosphatase (EEP) superfamily n=1 Tax=Sulfurivirga caldicuralii TaxID=364032 RepID=A0A1N6DCQ6_9GAMM|nr:endonuclease/exonuclease/phosphatase family protein [Sulfurivirga caldicuralii]SIN68572.1 Uncharacterized conserved protein YafD, endonuclease/exonuclease/phosphatase (EEP) superfamily [Sulfurivirga caldicuralii]